MKSIELTVMCTTEGCENFEEPIELKEYIGTRVICGPCGTTLEEEKDWFQPEEPPVDVDGLANTIGNLTTEERSALIKILSEE